VFLAVAIDYTNVTHPVSFSHTSPKTLCNSTLPEAHTFLWLALQITKEHLANVLETKIMNPKSHI
jgi:hypothetical protein